MRWLSRSPADMLIQGNIIRLQYEGRRDARENLRRAREQAERDNPLLPLYAQLDT